MVGERTNEREEERRRESGGSRPWKKKKNKVSDAVKKLRLFFSYLRHFVAHVLLRHALVSVRLFRSGHAVESIIDPALSAES